jgi:predicted amidohydrolase
MDDRIESNLTPSHVVVHAVTNNIPLQSVDECINNIEELIVGVKEKFPDSKIGISGIRTRQDIDSTSKVNEVNEKIKAISLKHIVLNLLTTHLWTKPL